jgi:hypothetical protein
MKLVRKWLAFLMPAFGGGGDGGGGESTQTTVQKSDPWSGVQPYLTAAYQQGWGLANQPGPYLYPGSTIPTQSPETLQSQQMRVGYANNDAASIYGPAVASWYQQLGAPDVVNSPWAQNAISAELAPIARSLTQDVLPGMSSKAIAEGAYTGNRFPIAQALAAQKATEAMGERAQASMLPLYTAGLDAAQRATAMTPLIQSSLLQPAEVLKGVGAEKEAREGAQLSEAAKKYEYEQQLPYLKLANFMNLIQGGSGVGGTSTSSTTGTTQQQSSSDPMSSALGGLMLYMAMSSDRRLKRDIAPIGRLPSGLPVYTFKYLWSDEERVGVMADEARQVFPEAVQEVDGWLTVNYARLA